MAGLGYALAVLGHREEALRCLQTMEDMAKCRYVPSTDFATIHAGLGDHEAAFEFLERAFSEKCLFLNWLHVWPPYISLRSDPRFANMLQRLGLSGGQVGRPVEQRP